jgi:lipoprotein-anchoring transpeptidase ErfK/SrfK
MSQQKTNLKFFVISKSTKPSFSGKLRGLFYQIINLRIKKFTFVSLVCFALLFLGWLYAKAYPDLYALREIYVINSENKVNAVGPKDLVSIKFSRPIQKRKAEPGFSIDPKIEGDIVWQDNLNFDYAQTFTFRPKNNFKPDTTYRIKFSDLESFYGTKKKDATYFFQTVSSPKIKQIIPASGDTVKKRKPQFEVLVNKIDPYFYLLFELDPKVDLEVKFDHEKSKFIITPKVPLLQGAKYKFKISKYFSAFGGSAVGGNPEFRFINSDGTIKEGSELTSSTEYIFWTMPAIEIVDTFPEDKSKDAGQKSEVRISFNRRVDYQSAEERFSIDPKTEGDFGWEEKTLIFKPKKLSSLKEYKVKIARGVKGYDDEGFLENDQEFSFKTKINPKEVIPDVAIIPQILEGKYIDIDISDQILTIFEDGKSLGSFLTSTGKYGMPTPLGQFKVLSKSELAYSHRYNLYMPFWMQFTSVGHGIHELPFWKYKGGKEYKEREAHLGTRVSHGCVRLGVGPAEQVYNWAEVGTPIVIHD